MQMKISGNIKKLKNTLQSPVKYELPIDEALIELNPFIGKSVRLQYDGEINCISCGRKTRKSFQQGYCYPCFQSLPECDSCIIKPELCHYHEGTCRDSSWGELHCFQDHIVYLSKTSGIKVGITRQPNVPSRWIDQGAIQALPVFRVKDRLTSGKVEMIFKQHVADKTAWQRMLKGETSDADLAEERERLYSECKSEIQALEKELGESAIQYLANDQIVNIDYPVVTYPEKVKSFNFDKMPVVEGVLQGIKGQYLILDSGVLNIRKFSGYLISLEV